MTVTLLIADHDETFREMVKRFLRQAGRMKVVAEATTGEEAVRLAAERQPDVVLMDVGISGMDGIEATHHIKQDRPSTGVVLLTTHDEEAYLSATGKSGADTFLPKRRLRSDLLVSVREVLQGLPRAFRAVERRLRRANPDEVLGWSGMDRRRCRLATGAMTEDPSGVER
jgi:DNA-binding NarL/FixJ family response regulator